MNIGEKLKIKVTAKHINSAGICVYNCPIALAVREKGLKLDVYHFGDNLILHKPSSHTLSLFEDLPRSVKRFVKRFDTYKKVKPFNFFITRR